MPELATAFRAGLTQVHVCDTAEEMGELSARRASLSLQAAAAASRETVFWVMAAPSAFAFYGALVGLARQDPRLASVLARTHYFQFDDYPIRRGDPAFPATFRYLLEERFFRPLKAAVGPLDHIHPLELAGDGGDAAVAARYGEKLLELKAGGAFLLQLKGVGMDGHWGFHGAETPLKGEPAMIAVPMNEANRHQQLSDHPALFKTAGDVPGLAYTFNVAMFLKADEIIDNVPQAAKEYSALACYGSDAVLAEIPSSAIKAHPSSMAFLTAAAARTLLELRAARAADASARLNASALRRLDALWDDPAAPGRAAANQAAMRAVLARLGML